MHHCAIIEQRCIRECISIDNRLVVNISQLDVELTPDESIGCNRIQV